MGLMRRRRHSLRRRRRSGGGLRPWESCLLISNPAIPRWVSPPPFPLFGYPTPQVPPPLILSLFRGWELLRAWEQLSVVVLPSRSPIGTSRGWFHPRIPSPLVFTRFRSSGFDAGHLGLHSDASGASRWPGSLTIDPGSPNELDGRCSISGALFAFIATQRRSRC